MIWVLIKFLLIAYLIYKLVGFVVRLLFANAFQQQKVYNQNNHQAPKHKPSGGNVSIDYVPDNNTKNPGSIKGGEYVDYEDVKD
ncbi:DUF4834 family protein [Marinoscillum sp. MHG1-6]|uniref:DUF4834 family protein n=1 Tax=Marinoscillum sp. MHG1-6 TaxID=2959627 RepID=UPI0021589F31|nr:DUF4834 family protein [Marinoscillum sp. MHG1-6]